MADELCDQDRYGVGLISTQTKQLLPWRTRLWDDNLQFVGTLTVTDGWGKAASTTRQVTVAAA